MSARRTLLSCRSALLIIAFVAFFLPYTGKAFATGQPAPAVSTIDPDGDDERTELLYHWQDKRFSDEEQHQTLFCSLLISSIIAGGAVRRQIKRNRMPR